MRGGPSSSSAGPVLFLPRERAGIGARKIGAYQAFLSYSHAADGKLAPALQAGLQRFAKPWYRRRALRVFRDTTDLSVSPGLWGSIEAALRAADFYVLLASQEGARSKWVARELEFWLSERTAARMFLILTDGDIFWDAAAGDFDWQRTTALPRSIAGRLKEEPLFLDLRWARTATDLALTHPRFRDAIADLAAPLHGVAKSELIGEDVRQHRRTITIVRWVGFALLALTTASGVAGYVAFQQRSAALRERDVADERLLRTFIANGTRASDEGDASGALLWFAEALELSRERPDEHETLRLRIGSTLRWSPAVEQLTSACDSSHPHALLARGTHVACFPDDSTHVRIVDVERGAAMPLPLDGNAVQAIDVSVGADGARVLTVDADGLVAVWDPLAQAELWQARHDAAIGYAEFSRDGTRIVSASDDKTARVWDARSGALLASLPHDGAVVLATLGADGRTVASAEQDGTLRVWDSTTQASVTLESKVDCMVLELSPDMQHVLTAHAADRVARLWNALTGEHESGLGDWAWVDFASFSPDGRWIAMALRNGEVLLWNVAGDELGASIRLDGLPTSVAFSSDSARVVTCGSGNTARVWSTGTGEARSPTLWHETTVVGAAFLGGGDRVVTVTADGVARVWSLGTAADLAFRCDSLVDSVAFDPAGARLLARTDSKAYVMSASDASAAPLMLDPQAQISCARFSPDGTRVVTGDLERTARVWDARTGVCLQILSHEGRVKDLDFRRDGEQLAVAAGGAVVVWDPQTGRELLSMRSGNPVLSVEFDATGTRLLTLDFQGEVRVWDAATGRELAHLQRRDCNRASYSSDGARIATAKFDGSVQAWDASTGAPLSPEIEQDGGQRATSLAFSPDGTRLLTASEWRSARVWDIATGAAVTRPLLHESRVMRAVFSGDGRYVLTASGDFTARVWDAITGEPITPPLQHAEAVRDAAFSPDGRLVATASHDDFVRIWRMDPADGDPHELRASCQLRAARKLDKTGAFGPLEPAELRTLWDSRASRRTK